MIFPNLNLPRYLTADFVQAAMNLLPRGRAWAKYQGSNLYLLLSALMPTYERNSLAATNLLLDILPFNTIGLLPEWEASLGLPDPCSGPAATIEMRRDQVVARFIATGGQSIPYIIAYAAALGFTITISESDGGFLMGLSSMGLDVIGSEGMMFIWYVHSALRNLRYFEMGVNVMGDALGSFDNNLVLECELRAIAPAYTLPIFLYDGSIILSDVFLYNDGGVLCVMDAAGWPAYDVSMMPGDFYSNGGVVSIVSGGTWDGTPQILFGNITAADLLARGGNSLTTVEPIAGSFVLWNNGDEVWIA